MTGSVCRTLAAAVALSSSLVGWPRLHAQQLSGQRRPIEGTWQLVAWRVGSDTLRAPSATGVFSVRDGIIIWQIHGTHRDTTLDRAGLGTYSAGASTFSYEYGSGLEVDRAAGQPAVVHDSLPFAGRRAFRLVRRGAQARYETSDGRQVYTISRDTLSIVQNGLLSRLYVRARERLRATAE